MFHILTFYLFLFIVSYKMQLTQQFCTHFLLIPTMCKRSNHCHLQKTVYKFVNSYAALLCVS